MTPKYKQPREAKNHLNDRSFSPQSLGSTHYDEWAGSKEPALKHSLEIKKNMERIRRISPNFGNMKFNNYDNHVKYVRRDVHENFDVHNTYHSV